MSAECLRLLELRAGTIRGEFERLQRLRLHRQRQSAIPSNLVPFDILPEDASWGASIELTEIGTAAAREESWVVDIPDDLGVTRATQGAAVLVSSDALDPVAKRSQWVLLAADDVACNDGDLVAATCASDDRLLRRVWSNGELWTFESINSVRPIASVIAPQIDAAVRRIVGVLYESSRQPNPVPAQAIGEWQSRPDFQLNWLEELASVAVTGTSLEPIARAGQHVLIDKQPVANHRQVHNGELAVVDTQVDGIGRVIKRVYHLDDDCILTSPNPVDPHRPEHLSKAQLVSARFHVVRGVLF